MPFCVFRFGFYQSIPFAVFIFDDSELPIGSQIQSIPVIASLCPHREGERRLAALYDD
jgi:hypothetical protein